MRSLHSPVDFLSVPHLHHEDKESFIPNVVGRPVVLPRSHVDGVEFLLRRHFLYAMRTRIVFEAENVPVHLISDTRI